MNINILGTKVHDALVVFGLCVLVLFGCVGVISWGGWKINQQDEKHSEDTTNLKSLADKLKNENEKSQNETKKLSSEMENHNGKLKEETENLNQKIQLMQKFKTFLFNKYCNGKECLLCHKGWIFFSDSCYFLSSVSLSWDQSRRFCQLKSADLVVINNQQEQEFIHGKINNNGYYWLGLQSNGNNWVWIDGRVDTLRFWSWYDYYYYYYNNGACAYMYRSGYPTASWYTTLSSNHWFYPLCELKAFTVSLN